MAAWQHTLALGAGLGAAFLAGRMWPLAPGAEAALHAQGRGPVNAPPSTEPVPPDAQPPERVVYVEESAQTAIGNGFVAVTGSYGVGTSVLYLIDTQNRQLAVYEARGGSSEQRRIVLVGARRIDLDLQLEGYNDRSEFAYSELLKLFDRRGGKDRSVRTGLERSPR